MLLEAGKETAVRFFLEGIPETVRMQASVTEILKQTCRVRQGGIINPVFQRNLLKIDSGLPFIYAGIVYMYYRRMEKEHSFFNLTKQLKQENALRFSENWVYEDKLGKLLCAAALGMCPQIEWDGGQSQLVRKVCVEKEGQDYYFQGCDRDGLGRFLMENCQVRGIQKEASGLVQKKDGNSFIELSVEIYF